MEPSLIGGEVNYILMAYQNRHNRLIQYKVGPDRSNIDSCMIGGIVSNNLSTICYGRCKIVSTQTQICGSLLLIGRYSMLLIGAYAATSVCV